MKHLKFLIILALVVVIATATSPARASGPEKFDYPVYEYIEIECQGYNVAFIYEGTITVIDHPEKGFANVVTHFQDTLYRTDGVGNTYTHAESNSSTETADGTIVHGEYWHVVIPGYGNIMLVSGHFLIDLEGNWLINFHGHYDFEPTDLCAPFAE